jgi:hypothetical protein
MLKLSFGNLDAVFKYSHRLTPDLAFNVDIGSKTRAPSYQELYLWLPRRYRLEDPRTVLPGAVSLAAAAGDGRTRRRSQLHRQPGAVR